MGWKVLAGELEILLAHLGRAALEIRFFEGELGEKPKSEHWDIVTKADTKVERRLARWIRKNYPDHGIVGEEGTSSARASNMSWRLDPIDGTAMFAQGAPYFGISLGLLEDGVPVFGAVEYPASATFAWAARGEGTFVYDQRMRETRTYMLNPPMRVRPTGKRLCEAVVVANLLPEHVVLYPAVRRAVRNAVTFGCFVFDTLELVRGHVDAVFHTGATPYDVAAAIVLVEEAGCTVSGLTRPDFDFGAERHPIVMARNKSLHDELCDALRAAD